MDAYENINTGEVVFSEKHPGTGWILIVPAGPLELLVIWFVIFLAFGTVIFFGKSGGYF